MLGLRIHFTGCLEDAIRKIDLWMWWDVRLRISLHFTISPPSLSHPEPPPCYSISELFRLVRLY
ncbi:hypothetical protein Hanom_Chr12g01180221 [Helianthus anomalus]